MGELYLIAVSFPSYPEHGLPEPDPLAGVALVAVEVVAFGGEAHGEDIVGILGGLVPHGREGDVHSDAAPILQHVDPGEAVGIGPDGVVDPCEIDVYRPVSLFQEVRQQEAHFEVGKGELGWEVYFVPVLEWGRLTEGAGHELGPGIGQSAARRAHGAGEHIEEEQGPGHHPTAQVSRRCISPDVAGEGGPGLSYLLSNVEELLGGDAGFGLRPFEGISPVESFSSLTKLSKEPSSGSLLRSPRSARKRR